MSDKSIVSNQHQSDGESYFPEVPLTELLQEIEQTPREYRSNLQRKAEVRGQKAEGKNIRKMRLVGLRNTKRKKMYF